MKHLLSTIIALLSFTMTYAQENVGVNFIEGKPLSEVLEIAKSEKKLVFVDCFTEWCGPCKMMANQEFVKKEAGDFFNPLFVCTKIDMEKGEGPELAKKFQVSAYPTFLILNAEGELVGRCVGGSTIDRFIPLVKNSMDEENSIPNLKKKYDEGKRDKEFLLKYIDALDRGYMRKDVKAVVMELFSNMSAEEIIADKACFDAIQKGGLTPDDAPYLAVYDKIDLAVEKYGEKARNGLDAAWYSYGMSCIKRDRNGYSGFNQEKFEKFQKMMAEHNVKNAASNVERVLRYKASYSKDYDAMYEYLLKDIKALGKEQPKDDLTLYTNMLELAKNYKSNKKAMKTIKDFTKKRVEYLRKVDTSKERKFTHEGKEYTSTTYNLSKYEEVLSNCQ